VKEARGRLSGERAREGGTTGAEEAVLLCQSIPHLTVTPQAP